MAGGAATLLLLALLIEHLEHCDLEEPLASIIRFENLFGMEREEAL